MAQTTLEAVAPPETAPATFLNVHGFNDVYWRCEAPARAVGARTELIHKDDMNDLLVYPHDVEPFRWHVEFEDADGVAKTVRSKREWEVMRIHPDTRIRLNSFRIVYPDLEGAAIWIRPDGVRAGHAAQMWEDGVRTIAEVDDNYVSDPNQSFAMKLMDWDETSIEVHMKSTMFMDAVVFSTEYLRDQYVKKTRKWWGSAFTRSVPCEMPEFHVCHNNADERDWPDIIERDGPIRVGWMGSPSHIRDVDLAWNALRWAKENGAETWMIGFDPIGMMKARTMKVNGEYQFTKSAAEYIRKWEQVDFRKVEWRQPEQYERFALPLDIGLCPLVTNEHTLGKSDVKFLEYTISGAATVAQNNAVYNRTIVHGETGLLAGSPREFIECVSLLMKDEKLRLELVANAQQYIRENRGLKQMRDEWMAAING